jgi:putative membrane protein
MMGPWGWIWMLVWIAALLFMVWLIVRSPSEHSTAEDAMAILRARFARGEISREEYERAKGALLADQQAQDGAK